MGEDAIGHGEQGLRPVRYALDSIVTDRANAWQRCPKHTYTEQNTHTLSSNETSILTFSTDSQGT